jgi:hypothetical protein
MFPVRIEIQEVGDISPVFVDRNELDVEVCALPKWKVYIAPIRRWDAVLVPNKVFDVDGYGFGGPIYRSAHLMEDWGGRCSVLKKTHRAATVGTEVVWWSRLIAARRIVKVAVANPILRDRIVKVAKDKGRGRRRLESTKGCG